MNTDVTRRSFLAVLSSALIVNPKTVRAFTAPVLVGDGKTDEADILNVMASGNPIWYEGRFYDVDDDIRIFDKKFLISKTIDFTSNTHPRRMVYITNCEFTSTPEFSEQLYVEYGPIPTEGIRLNYTPARRA